MPTVWEKNKVNQFQSHFGLILTEFSQFVKSDELEFQSHFGLILTENRLEEIMERYEHFNPILVWF